MVPSVFFDVCTNYLSFYCLTLFLMSAHSQCSRRQLWRKPFVPFIIIQWEKVNKVLIKFFKVSVLSVFFPASSYKRHYVTLFFLPITWPPKEEMISRQQSFKTWDREYFLVVNVKPSFTKICISKIKEIVIYATHCRVLVRKTLPWCKWNGFNYKWQLFSFKAEWPYSPTVETDETRRHQTSIPGRFGWCRLEMTESWSVRQWSLHTTPCYKACVACKGKGCDLHTKAI